MFSAKLSFCDVERRGSNSLYWLCMSDEEREARGVENKGRRAFIVIQ